MFILTHLSAITRFSCSPILLGLEFFFELFSSLNMKIICIPCAKLEHADRDKG